MASLKSMEIKTSDEKSRGMGMRSFQRYYYFGVALLPCLYFLAAFNKDVGSAGMQSNHVCHQKCSTRRDQRYEYFKGRDILDTNDLLNQVADDTKALIKKLEIDYGAETFAEIFMNSDGKVRPFVPFSVKSTVGLRRKLQIKVLLAQQNLRKKESVFSGCDCINGDIGIPGSVKSKTSSVENNNGDFPALDTSFENYIWATGGHSASAAHGNLYNESYTAFMERDLKGVFGAIGIDFQGRNYAMGGTSSAAEMSMCWNEIFGTDVDFFSWDYGMTDAGKPWRFMHYGYSGGTSPGRPAFMGIRVNQDRRMQNEIIQLLEDNGIPTFIQDDKLWTTMRKGIPDTFGLSTDEINAMPEYVRNFKCNGVIEKGEPFCEAEKYSNDICVNREGKAPWHPGIKTHAMVGHSLALFLIDNLLAALQELIDLNVESADTFLSQLSQQDKMFHEQLMATDFKDKAGNLYSFDEENKGILDPSVFFSGKRMCHTARLPAQARYRGYLTNTEKVGGPAPMGKETFEVGVEEKEALPDLNTMQLIWTDEKMHNKCPVTVNVDHKDSFFSTGSGWKTLTFPNEAERKAYNYNPAELQGIVVISFTVVCNWDDCEEASLGPDDLGGDAKKWNMKINGTPVKKFLGIGHGAVVAKGTDGVYFPPSPENDYKFEIKVEDPSKYVKISSFIVY